MNRRDLLKRVPLLMAAGVGVQLLPHDAYGAACVVTDHLNGEIPEDANPAISSTGQFHHYHYLHVPQIILANPPANGWTTITSMMRPELGIDDFFFRREEERKQFHCHQVSFTRTQLRAIAAGTETTVTAFINRRPNHTFLFNKAGLEPKVAFEQEEQRIRRIAEERRLRFQSALCDTNRHRGVTVFTSTSSSFVTRLEQLERLKGY